VGSPYQNKLSNKTALKRRCYGRTRQEKYGKRQSPALKESRQQAEIELQYRQMFVCIILYSLGSHFWFQLFYVHLHSFLHDYNKLGRGLTSRLPKKGKKMKTAP